MYLLENIINFYLFSFHCRAGEVSNKNLTIDDLFKIIQSFWEKLSKRDIHRLKSIKVTYENVIKPGHYNGVEAARYLQYCLSE